MLYIPRPVDEPCFAADGREINEAPKSAVKGIVPVVAHNKQLIYWHGNRAKIITGICGGRVNKRILEHCMSVKKLFPVYYDLFVPDFNYITSNADNSFYIIEFRVFRKLEHYNIISLWIRDRNKGRSSEWHLDTINEFTDQNMVPNLQGRQHRSGRNLKRLHDERADGESKNYG